MHRPSEKKKERKKKVKPKRHAIPSLNGQRTHCPQRQSAVINNRMVEVCVRHSNVINGQKKRVETNEGEKAIPSTEQMKAQSTLKST